MCLLKSSNILVCLVESQLRWNSEEPIAEEADHQRVPSKPPTNAVNALQCLAMIIIKDATKELELV